ncbi:MAG: substrate-binding domain-containing protein, partial [Phycisphaerales bacterium]|nr:substrate-binding domain-containing protein [Phycisphaerales bacterium]
MRSGRTLAILVASIAVVGVCIALLAASQRRSGPAGRSLTMFCAAGIKEAVEPIALDFEKETGITVRLEYGGAGTLLSRLKIKP